MRKSVNKAARIINDIVYGTGTIITAALCCLALFGSTQPVNPDAMLPISWREQAFNWLAFGTMPMLLACIAVYRINKLNNSPAKIRNFVLIFIPGFICGTCAIVITGAVLLGMLKYFLLNA